MKSYARVSSLPQKYRYLSKHGFMGEIKKRTSSSYCTSAFPVWLNSCMNTCPALIWPHCQTKFNGLLEYSIVVS
uniref:Uncharacterized protein n=1 Tax=Catharus ustulatus TaxID=91951 RepID=A0A8C3TYI5_CATUS